MVRARLEPGVTKFQVKGPVSRKSRQLFGPEKSVVKLQSACFEKLFLEYVFNVRKTKKIAKFDGLEPRRCEDIKGIVTPEIGPKSFGTSQKQTPALSTSFPESFISPPQREQGKKDPGSGWSRVLVTNLSSWEGPQLFRILTPLVFFISKTDFASFRATMESSLSISQRSLMISSTLPSTLETESGNCKKIRMSSYGM